MARYTTHAQWSRGKCIIPFPCCDMHIFHSGFMRVLNPERDQMKMQRRTSTTGFSKSFSRLNAICIDFRKHNCFVLKRNLLKHYINFFWSPYKVRFVKLPGNSGRFLINNNLRERVPFWFNSNKMWKNVKFTYKLWQQCKLNILFPKGHSLHNVLQIIVFVWHIAFCPVLGWHFRIWNVCTSLPLVNA